MSAALTPEALTRDVAAVRERVRAWRTRPLDERVYLLEGWAATWLDPALQRPDALHEVAWDSGLHPQTLAWGIDTTCGAIAQHGLRALLEAHIGDLDLLRGASPERIAHVPDVCGHVWASTLPTSGWLPVVGALALGAAAVIKAPAQTRAAAEHLSASMGEFDPVLGACVHVAQWPSGGPLDDALVHACDALIVSGGDAATRRFAALVAARRPAPIPYLPFGPGFSVAVLPAALGEDIALDALARAFALDVAAYDQRGCLSPQALWVETGGPWTAPDVAQAVAQALDAIASQMPRGDLSDGQAAAILQRRGVADFLGRAWPVRDACVLFEPEPPRASNPLGRTLPVHPFSDGPGGFLEALQRAYGLNLRLHSAGIAGDAGVRRAYAAVLGGLGASRVCAPGTMQAPPATWSHDGLRWVERLVRWVDMDV